MVKFFACLDPKQDFPLSGDTAKVNKEKTIMEDFRYLPGVTTLEYEENLCVGCGSCEVVCPHGVFAMNGKKVRLVDKDGCMECGAVRLELSHGRHPGHPGGGLCGLYHLRLDSWQGECELRG
jgi:ferredoxin